jgi:hypothetical protein
VATLTSNATEIKLTLARLFIWTKRDEVTGGSRTLHNEELHNLYSSPRMIKSRRMRWAEHSAHMRILKVKPERKRLIE